MNVKGFIEKAFPVPRALVLSDVSVAISDGFLRFFEFSRFLGKLKPKAFGALPFPRIHISVKDDKARAEATAALATFAASKKYTAVRAIIHEGDAYVFKARVATLSPAEVRPAIEAILEENVPIPPGEAVFEYDTVSIDEKRHETVVAVSVVSESVLSEYVNIFRAGSLQVVSFETEARALARTLFARGDEGNHAVVSIGQNHSIVFVVENGGVVFSSSVEVGSSDLDRAVSKTFDISMDEARALRSQKSFSEDGDNAKLFGAMIPVFSAIHDELGKILIYSKSEAMKGGASAIADIVLSGGDSMMAGFASYISITSKLPVRIGSAWTNIPVSDREVPALDRRQSLDYGTVIGALLS